MLDSSECKPYVVELLNQPWFVPNATWFYQNTSGILEAYPAAGRITLTLEGCMKLCGPGTARYPSKDIGARFTAWYLQ